MHKLTILRFQLSLVASACFLSSLHLASFAGQVAGASFDQKVLEVIKNNPEAILESLSRYQQTQDLAKEEARLALIRLIQENPSKYLNDSPVFGGQAAKTRLYVFADFQCPYCSQVRGNLQQFVLDHPTVSLVYKHYPIVSIHPEAMDAALASWAAHRQGKFWQYHDILYAHQERLGNDLYLEAASELGLDIAQFNADRKSQAAKLAVKSDIDLAEGLGITGTPFFLMNDATFSGLIDSSALRQKL